MDKVEIAIGDYPAQGEPYIAIKAIDRLAIIELLDECAELQSRRGRDITGFTITMPCGYTQKFTNHFDIPSRDFLCGCGRTNHYLIKYGKE